MEKAYNGPEDVKNVIKDLLLAFFTTTEKNSTINILSSEGMKFCDKYHHYFDVINSDFDKVNPLHISLILDTIYTAYITNSYNKETILCKQKTENVISMFQVASAFQYIESCDKYCKVKKYSPIPDCFKTVIHIVSRKFISEQNVYKYCKDYTSEMVEGEESFKAILKTKTADFENNINKLSETTKNSIRETEKRATETNITILGIFSAIVLTFNAGVSFASIVMENLISSSIYRAISITLIFSLILGNVILGLFSYLERVRCSDDSSSQNYIKPKNEDAKFQKFIVFKSNNIKTKADLPATRKKNSVKRIALIMNIVIIGLLLINGICWLRGVAEIRNVQVNSHISQMSTNDEA